ncbi:MAG: TetR/AcrR family transcriptional regulator [Bacteroidales bacterium]|nr:TetR/AcrR family transcriptional regulator [Bacteroidales bacterium]MCF8391257.1 TetR/AcrR family transcriptional regulator [Bacteroidales bacterium]
MTRKREDTSAFILKNVAPIFNRKGYSGTSLRDITTATELSKGSVYGNFKNKTDLAVKAFYINVEKLIQPMIEIVAEEKNSIKQLLALTDYYRNYYILTLARGGCPVLNVGVDAKYNSPELFNAAKDVSDRLVRNLAIIIKKGIKRKEIKKKIKADLVARNMYSMIEGGIFMASVHEDKGYLTNILDQIEKIILKQLKK